MSVGKLLRAGLPFANVVASGVATCSITPGRTIERIILALGGTSLTKAMLSLVKLKANGKTIFEGSGSQIDKLMAYRGIAAAAGFLVLDFTEIKGRDKLDQMIGGFDTSQGIASITMEVTIAGATAPTLAAYIVESGAQQGPYSPILQKVLRYPFNTSVGGKLNLQLPFGKSGAIIKRLHVEQAGDYVTAVEVKQDGLIIHESTAALNDFVQAEHDRATQANWYTVDFIVDGNQGNAFDTRDARSMEVNLTLSAADSGYVIAEYYDVLGNL